MNITPELTLTITVALTESEARKFLVDPATLQRDVRAALAAHHRAHAPTPAERARRGGRRANRKTAPKDVAALECPKCGRAFTSAKRLSNHSKSCQATASDAG